MNCPVHLGAAASRTFPLAEAEAVARGILEALRPHAERIEIAGSIRRRRPQVHDIDIVAIARRVSGRLLFGDSTLEESAFCEAALDLSDAGDGDQKLECVGDKIIRCIHGDSRISVDIYLAMPESWATLLLIRTGSAEHNIRLCTRARELGGKLHADGSGLELPGEYNAVLQRQETNVFYPQSEEEIFARGGIAYLPPSLREQGVTWQLTKSATEPQGRSA